MTQYQSGLFITLEGGEGCGKTTQKRLLAEELRAKGFSVVETREPGGTPQGELIREILLTKKLSPLEEFMLFSTARYFLTKEVIKPSLDKGMIVISDRFYDSSTVYQGYAGQLDIEFIMHTNEKASLQITPDITFLLDIEPAQGLAKEKEKTTFSRKPLAFHIMVDAGYKELAQRYSDRFRIISYIPDGIERMQQDIMNHLQKKLDEKFLFP